MLYKLFSKEYQRRYLFKKTDSPVMKDYLNEPFQKSKKLISEVDIVALDLETTGLNPQKDEIVSIGLVFISGSGINLDSCWHQLVSTNSALPEASVVIHKITDDQSSTGMNLDEAMPRLLKLLKGKVMLVHNETIEQGFVNKVCQAMYETDFVIPIIDTQLLAKRSLDRHNIPYKAGDLRLFNLRKQFNMPAYKAHNALMDAIATAELFLALVNEIAPGKDACLGDFLS